MAVLRSSNIEIFMSFTVCVCVCVLKVDSAWAAEDRERAHSSSHSARLWNIIGLVFGIGFHVTSVIAIVAVSASEA